MGSALLRGWLQASETSTSFTAYTRTKVSAERLVSSLQDTRGLDRVQTAYGDDIIRAPEAADIVLLGFLPNDLEEVLSTTRLAEILQTKIVVSMLAGVSIARLHKAVAAGTTTEQLQLARIIPTIAASFGESTTLIAESTSPPSAHVQTVDWLFSLVGSTVAVPERLMDEATAIGAAIHALTIVAVDAATDASVASGMPRATALALVTKSLQSAISLMTKGEMSPETMKAAMSTPAGITLNAVVDIDANARAGIAGSVTRAIKYTKSMSSS